MLGVELFGLQDFLVLLCLPSFGCQLKLGFKCIHFWLTNLIVLDWEQEDIFASFSFTENRIFWVSAEMLGVEFLCFLDLLELLTFSSLAGLFQFGLERVQVELTNFLLLSLFDLE